MFRKMRRINQQLSEAECIEILKSEPRGILSVLGDNDYPYGFPMNFIFEENKIYFHCAKEGHKIDSLIKHPKASFCVYDKGFHKDGHWSLNIRSVIVFGKIQIASDRQKAVLKMRKLAEKYYPDASLIENEMAHADRAECLELTIEHMSGKLVNES